MLTRLIIKNVALISSLNIELDGGLNILSGETGAGKSIIVDSLMLLLGGRYDKTLLKYGEAEGFVEGYFTSVEAELFKSIGLDEDEDAVIRRRFTAEGKNDIRINGQSITLTMLKRFASGLCDIYGQNEHQSLSMPARHLDILDYYVKADIGELLVDLELAINEYNDITKKLSSIGDESQRKRNIDILSYQIDEIHNANIGKNEELDTLDRRKLLLSAERIKTSLSEVVGVLSGNDESAGAIDLLASACKAMSFISPLSASYDDLYSRLDSVVCELGDIGQTIDECLEGVDFEDNELDQLEKRLDTIRNIKRKYGDYDAMNDFLAKAEEDLQFLQNSDEMYAKLMLEGQTALKRIYNISKSISDIRRKCARDLEARVIEELNELGMRDSRFEIVFSSFPAFDDCAQYISKNGMERVEFYLSANLGQPLLPLAKIISGGEMSRFMLALKVISASIDTVQTMIFDEIDAGISGAIGRIIAQKLAAISRKRQVICVTHLPQIAAMADTHYFINKQIDSGETVTNVTKLTKDQMINEICRLSGGQDISAQALASAKEIKDWSNTYKTSLQT